MNETRITSQDHSAGFRQHGVSVIELMIGMTMGLLISIALVKSFSGSEVFNRAVTGRADAQQAGALSSWRLTRELRLAGSGLGQGPQLWGCPLVVTKNDTALLPRASLWPAPFATLPQALRMVPIAVKSSVGFNGSDLIVMMAGTPGANVVPTPVNIVSATQIDLNTTTGFEAGDLLLVNDASAAGSCYVGQIDDTFTPSATGLAAPSQIATSNSGAPFNGPSGFTDIQTEAPNGDFALVNLGSTPLMQMIGLDEKNQLMVLDPLQIYTGSTPLAVAQNVVQLKALYGVDDGSNGGTLNDNIIDDWVTPTGVWSFSNMTLLGGPALRVKAVRIAMLVRSTVASGNPGATSRTLFDDLPSALQVTETISTSNSRYSYEVFDITIPLPNQVAALCSQHRRAAGVPSSTGCT